MVALCYCLITVRDCWSNHLKTREVCQIVKFSALGLTVCSEPVEGWDG